MSNGFLRCRALYCGILPPGPGSRTWGAMAYGSSFRASAPVLPGADLHQAFAQCQTPCGTASRPLPPWASLGSALGGLALLATPGPVRCSDEDEFKEDKADEQWRLVPAALVAIPKTMARSPADVDPFADEDNEEPGEGALARADARSGTESQCPEPEPVQAVRPRVVMGYNTLLSASRASLPARHLLLPWGAGPLALILGIKHRNSEPLWSIRAPLPPLPSQDAVRQPAVSRPADFGAVAKRRVDNTDWDS
jgi:hypothetical protein